MRQEHNSHPTSSIQIRDVRANDSDALAHILITAGNHAFTGLVPQQCLQFTEAESAINWKKAFARNFLTGNDVFVVAETHQKIVIGYAWGRPSDKEAGYQGELYQIHILPDYQGQGIGRLLLNHVVERLSEEGISSLWVRVLQVNPNRRFYEHLGALAISQEILDWDGVPMIACIYGWKNTSNIVTHL